MRVGLRHPCAIRATVTTDVLHNGALGFEHKHGGKQRQGKVKREMTRGEEREENTKEEDRWCMKTKDKSKRRRRRNKERMDMRNREREKNQHDARRNKRPN